MKIGILTQPLHYNYGGIMQCWALQQVLLRLGHRPEMIYLEPCETPSRELVVRRSLSFVKALIKKYLLGLDRIYLQSPLFPRYNPAIFAFADNRFVNRIRKTKAYGCDADIDQVVQRRGYDAFIVGSDQVWREEYSPNILTYFLDFLPENDERPRVAYAASFGKDKDYISSDKMPDCRRLLARFDAVSVRENKGIDIVRHDLGRQQVTKTLDPTLLLTASDYEKLILPADRRDVPYIASYILDTSDEKNGLLAKISATKNLSVSNINIEVNPEGMPTVSQWLANFADADFVVTDSFHGCVFSIIFGKPFIAIANAERGLDRFVSLLSEFDLTDRLIYSAGDFDTHQEQLLASLDYADVRLRLDAMRERSLAWLKKALEK